MSAFFLLLRVQVAVQDNALQNSVPHAGAPPRADARKLSRSAPRRLPRHPASA